MFPDIRTAWQLPPASAPVPTAVAASASGELRVSARVAYRLALSPASADAPSRLLVLQVRLTSGDDTAWSTGPENIVLALPDGAAGRIFDRARAVEVLHRTTLADADLSYLRGGTHRPGGLDGAERAGLLDLVLGNLLADQAFGGAAGTQGFVVVDTGVPLPTLDGATLQVVAHRLRDAVPVTAPYQFTAGPAAASATPAA